MGEIIDSIVGGLAGVIKFFAGVGGGNTAIGIILFTIAIRFAILPLTLKAVRSSRMMQQLQPMIKEINEKYKAKPGEKLAPEKNQEKMAKIQALYSEYQVNPAAGCLPILIQIPVFFAVYAAVTRSVGTSDSAVYLVQNSWNQFATQAATLTQQARDANSGLFWFNDLTKPDPTFVLPVLMVLFQFMTQKMAIPRGGGADENQKRMNNILQYMPLIFGVTALNFPAGPVLYWVTTSIFSTIQQFFITGWGSLGDVPGLGFLPQKDIKGPALKKRDPNDKPAKPSLMQRLAESQNRLESERGTKTAVSDAPSVTTTANKGTSSSIKSTASAADASKDTAEETRKDFGRKATGNNPALKTTGTVKKVDIKPLETDSPVRALNQEEQIRQAYRNLNRRPPKKGAGTSGGNPENGSDESPSKKK